MGDREKSEEITEGRRKLKRERNRDCREKQREDAEKLFSLIFFPSFDYMHLNAYIDEFTTDSCYL